MIKNWDGKTGTLGDIAVRIWDEVAVVRVSDIGDGFGGWLYGQTLPLVLDDQNPHDWAYYSDYLRWQNGLPIVD